MRWKRSNGRRRQNRRWMPPCCTAEALERRTLLSTYVINGTGGTDIWHIEANAGQVFIAGVGTINNPAITDVQVNGFAGDDVLVINHASIPIAFNGGDGNDLLSLTSGLLTGQITSTIRYDGGGSAGDQAELRDEIWPVYANYSFSGGLLDDYIVRWGNTGELRASTLLAGSPQHRHGRQLDQLRSDQPLGIHAADHHRRQRAGFALCQRHAALCQPHVQPAGRQRHAPGQRRHHHQQRTVVRHQRDVDHPSRSWRRVLQPDAGDCRAHRVREQRPHFQRHRRH